MTLYLLPLVETVYYVVDVDNIHAPRDGRHCSFCLVFQQSKKRIRMCQETRSNLPGICNPPTGPLNIFSQNKVIRLTRKHSSRMRTSRLPTVSHCIPCPGGCTRPPRSHVWGVGTHPPGHTHPLGHSHPQNGPGTRYTKPPGTWYQRYLPPGKDMGLELPTLPCEQND